MRGRPVAPTAFAVPLSQPSPAAVHLLCVPYAGGGAAVFRHWPALLPPTLAVSAIRLPGRESRIGEPPLADIGQMVTAAADDLAADTATGRPYALFGHSFGALVAFELAREMRARDLPAPRRLFVSAHRAPDADAGTAPLGDLSDQEFLDKVTRYGGMPQEVLDAPDLLDMVLPALRADIDAAEGYRFVPGAPLNCPISVFGGRSDSVTPQAQLYGWRSHSVAEVDVRLFDGGHFFLHDHRTAVTTAIGAALGALPDGAALGATP
ncbi:thioesterase II family protein [Nonomuraea glycinis]|uniref:thioesterase II family protein n=1 Tax=Nonomuraea glycinis TaxID=2047744 RepID=UPI00339E4548